MAEKTRYFSNEAVRYESKLSSDNYTAYAEQLMDACLHHYEGSASAEKRRKPQCKTSLGTLYHGALGSRVYLRLRMAQYLKTVKSGEPARKKSRSSTSESLLNEALKLAHEAVQIESERMKHHRIRVTLLEGPYVGAKCLLAALYHNLGHASKAIHTANEVLELLQQSTRALTSQECEVLYGRAGALHAIFFLRKELQEENFGSQQAVEIAQSIVNEGSRNAATSKRNREGTTSQTLPLQWEWHGKKYLGAAHGVVGILHTLLCLTKAEQEQIVVNGERGNLLPLLEETVKALDCFCWPESGNLRSSIHTSSSQDKLVHWCHGAPGHVLLLVKAYEVTHDASYLQKARTISRNVIWPRGLLRKGVGLCHGISGNAYSLLALGRTELNENGKGRSKDRNDDEIHNQRDQRDFLQQACYFASFALEKWSALQRVPDHPFSVFEGAGGLALLMMDLGALHHKGSDGAGIWALQEARFPLYDF